MCFVIIECLAYNFIIIIIIILVFTLQCYKILILEISDSALPKILSGSILVYVVPSSIWTMNINLFVNLNLFKWYIFKIHSIKSEGFERQPFNRWSFSITILVFSDDFITNFYMESLHAFRAFIPISQHTNPFICTR